MLINVLKKDAGFNGRNNNEEEQKESDTAEFRKLTDEELDPAAGGQNGRSMMKVADYNNGSIEMEKQINEYPRQKAF